MRRNSWWFLGLCAVLSSGAASLASAQQLKPYFLVIVDTSGSMGWCAAGATDSLGANDCSCLTNSSAPCPCFTDNSCTDAQFRTNRCGFPSNKLGDAKCALQRILDGTGGDATFGLMQFSHPCDDSCRPTGAQCTGNQQACGTNCNDAQLAVEIASGNATLMREWVDGVCGQGACGTNNFRHELTTGQWTPLAQSLQRANDYLRGNTLGALPFVTGGGTPAAPLDNDPQLACRPVSVILLTDGDDTCTVATAAPAAATALNTGDPKAGSSGGKAFRTYVIGFGASGGNFSPGVLDNIATSGGTDSHDGSGHKYFPAMNEEQLSLALNRIIADAQPPTEICNNKDDDCDTKIDEGLPKYCNKPAGQLDATLCDEPNETKCDGQDDDCDGIIDEGLTNACGACGDLPKEVCDNIDNDCDRRIDEDTDAMESCGSSKGECKTGQLVCTSGMEQCRGEIGPNKEICDCKDNDCDGATDESNPDALCPEGQRCAGCRCVEFCKQTAEFTAMCPPGLAPDFQPNGECLCIVDACDQVGCPKSTIMNDDGTPSCAPNNSRVAPCECRAGTCIASCSGITCQSGQVCDPRHGRCVEDNCRGLGCASQELCDPGSGRCVKDACASASCQPDEVCRAGKCETSCAAVSCSSGQRCSAGSCEADPCAAMSCGTGEVCDPARGQCVTDICAALQCKSGQSCSPSTGKCEADPCWNVKCPKPQTCVGGECRIGASDTTTRTSPEKLAGPSRLLATGGGGCACSVPGRSLTGLGNNAPPARAAWLLLAVLGVCRWRRRNRRGSLAVLALLGAVASTVALAGCRVSPICVDCTDSGALLLPGQNSDVDATFDNPDAAANPALDGGQNKDNGPGTGDAGIPSGMKCVPSGPELCNDKDDDCDFKVDEDVVPTKNDCNQVGVCAGALPVCTNGSFACRYGEKYEPIEQSCDGLDNDCNGRVDESFAMLGSSCDVGVGACKTTGTWRCNSSAKGLSCDAKPAPSSAEVCNGKDDDCDGMIDEPKNNPGSNPSYVKDDVVKVRDGLWMYKYEASRVDAEASKQGIVDVRTCSRAGVLPWTNVTYTEALAACQSVDMTLCNVDDWVFACEGGNTKCAWSTAGSCSSYMDGACNGHNTSTQSGEADSDALQATGNKSACYAELGDGRVFDLSGNAKEWTTGSQSPDTNPLRGGSYNNSAEGLRCDFDFALGAKDLRLPNIGFRCCSNVEP